MTRPSRSGLVMDGRVVKARLVAERQESSNVVHIDWLRFTCYLRNADIDTDLLFPLTVEGNYWDVRKHRLERALRELENTELFSPAGQALTLANRLVECLGEGFTVDTQLGRGHDFYAKRWLILYGGRECGWVGFGASGDSPRQQAQKNTIHANLWGTACTFAAPGWRHAVRDLIREVKGHITRVDLALDFFDGYDGGIESVQADYMAGRCDVNGKRPKCSMAGDWCNGAERSFYLGSREAGKQTNVYEKGHQLFGRESGSKWLRFELRYGNKLREIHDDVLTDADSYFAGASEWHMHVLHRITKGGGGGTPLPTRPSLPLKTIEAEVARNMAWFERVAAPTFKLLFEFVDTDKLLNLFQHKQMPGRLSAFSREQLKKCYEFSQPPVLAQC